MLGEVVIELCSEARTGREKCVRAALSGSRGCQPWPLYS